ncbi:sce7725 family protein [Pedobacter gandavensis]|uniref:sce7725 family protein n=1 Tax=Pedobacter gandavensis TaxID=2679963 RepID=UPI002930EFE1|nr:sce7725 family protein [Pedobacter gandavensis]
MYFPFLRGKQFEIEALLEVPNSVFNNTLPIIEPVNLPRRKFYKTLSQSLIPFVLITNPYHPISNRVSPTLIQDMIDSDLVSHPSLLLGFIVDTRFNITELNAFLTSNPTRHKVLIFHYDPLISDLSAIKSAITSHPVEYLVFDSTKSNISTRTAFNTHSKHVLLTDGFQRQNRNSDYPVASTFDSNFDTWRSNGFAGIGDYSIIGNHFKAGGGAQVVVVTLHLTIKDINGLVVHHFSSTFKNTKRGFAAQKFSEANGLLLSSAHTSSITSGGLDIYRDLDARSHNPQLGIAKKASIIHHIELLSSII